ncbi:hypothetical protein GDO81_008342 [Engystomops pustulosus]|uniref:ELYS-like domain-containing protein n=2 Tax=Engystomops pustulosus TaxID=76066 RepID=A0AAV7CEP2_ENGPU|nr:hypothetical protein GDO81_008342 [Engystomops pustulosus]
MRVAQANITGYVCTCTFRLVPLEDADEKRIKHAITVYFLLDVMYSLPDKPDSSIESFPTAFSVPCGLIKLIQGFWLLDHNDYQNSVDCILHPAASRVMTWQHNLIIETLMCQGEYRQALRYIQVMKPPISNSTEVKLHMTVFLANRHIFEAWNLQKLHSSRLNIEDLLKHMYEMCQEMALMEDLLKLTFTDSEQDYLQKFLHSNGSVQNQELLLVHHLQRANYIPALQLNQSLKNYHLNDCDRRQRERAVARKSILDQYGKILPSVQQTLASDRARPYPSIVWKKVTRPKPLSTIAKQAPTGSVITEANFIRNVLMKIKEVSVASENRDFSPYKSFTEESQVPVSQVTELEVPDAFVGTPISKSKSNSRLLGSLVHPILAEPTFETDLSKICYSTPRKSNLLLTSSPVQSSLLKATQLKNLCKASEFNLLETPLVVKKAKALVAGTASSGFIAHTPQSILRSSARTTPLASPSVSPGRSITPPLRSKETRIAFMEEISKKYTKGVLSAEQEEPSVSPVLKSQETMWAERVAMLTQNDMATDNEDLDESSSGIQDGSPSKMEISKDASNVSARSNQTTLEYHDAPTPEDLEDEVVLTTKIHSSISEQPVQKDVDIVLVTEDLQPISEPHVDEVLLSPESDPEVAPTLIIVEEPEPPVNSVLDPAEDDMQPSEVEVQSVVSTGSSVSVISHHSNEDVESTHSEIPEHEIKDNEVEIQNFEENVVIVEEIPAVTDSPPPFTEIQDLNDKINIVVPESNVMHKETSSLKTLDGETAGDRECSNDNESTDDKDPADDGTDVEVEHSEAPSNFSLILEGDDDYPKVELLMAGHPTDQNSEELEKDLCAPKDENLVETVSTVNICENSLTLGGTEHGTKITETLPYMPEPIEVAIPENLLDALKETRSKDITADVNSGFIPENESGRKLGHVHATPKTPVKKANQTNTEHLADNEVLRITPPEESDEQKLGVDTLQTSPDEGKSTQIRPPTPRRSIRKSSKAPESTNELEIQLPTTPKRGGRKTKDHPENMSTTLVTVEEEQESITITRISRRTKSAISDQPEATGSETVTEEPITKPPSSPARTRRGKAAAMDDQINTADSLDQNMPTTPTRITRSSKVIRDIEKEPNVETEPLVTTPTRGRRGKRVVNELVKHFELGAPQASNKSDVSPPVSPKKVSLRWSRIKSDNQIEEKKAEEDNSTAQEASSDTARKTAKKTIRKVDTEESTDDAEEQKRTTRVTRTRSNNLAIPDTPVEFAFATPTPRRRKNAKVEQSAPPVSPSETPGPVASDYMFSPPSLRTRRSTRTVSSVVPKEKDGKIEESEKTITVVPEKKPRGRPPKHRAKKEQAQDKATWSPPPVKIQLLSPPESPTDDSESTRPMPTEPKAAEKNLSQKTRRRIVTSKPVTRRKIR